jgi:hypothetical protein
MFRIERDSDGRATNLQLSGRIQSDQIACIRKAMDDGSTRKLFDLSDVTLVDRAAIRFFIGCEDGGIELAQCPLWVREWMLRERAEEEQERRVSVSVAAHRRHTV